MSDKMIVSLLTLPVDLVYRILDNLDDKAIFLSVRDVCQRLNIIIDTYHRYQVNYSFIFKLTFHHLRIIIHFMNGSYFLVHSRKVSSYKKRKKGSSSMLMSEGFLKQSPKSFESFFKIKTGIQSFENLYRVLDSNIPRKLERFLNFGSVSLISGTF